MKPILWKVIPDKVKLLVMEVKREEQKKMDPPFVNQSKTSTSVPKKNRNISEPILKSTKQNTPTPQQLHTPQPLPN